MDWLERLETERKSPSRYANVVERTHDVADLIVNRDPCPKCGVRGDLGCKHRRNV